MKWLLGLVLSMVSIVGMPSAEAGDIPSTEIVDMEVINYTDHISTSSLKEWTRLAEARVKNRKSRVLAVVYPIGEYLGKMDADWHHMGSVSQHRVLLSPEEVESIMDALEGFVGQSSCLQQREKTEELKRLRGWLETGFDSASQVAICSDLRLVMIAVQPDRPEEDLEYTWYHELYHAFQQSLRSCEDSDEDTMWIVEAGAAYFGTAMVLQRRMSLSDLKSRLLQTASEVIDRHDAELADPGIAEKGAAAFRFMVDKGWLDEERILDASLYHDCRWIAEFQADNPKVVTVKNEYHRIVNSNGGFDFETD